MKQYKIIHFFNLSIWLENKNLTLLECVKQSWEMNF